MKIFFYFYSMICKPAFERVGKAVYNALPDEDKRKYLTASGIVEIIKEALKIGDFKQAAASILIQYASMGKSVIAATVIAVSKEITGYAGTLLDEAIEWIVSKISSAKGGTMWGEYLHDIATKIAVFLGVDEVPGLLAAVMEWISRKINELLVKFFGDHDLAV